MTDLTKEEMQDDLAVLCQWLVDSHPDPFMGSGGAVNFYRRVDAVYRALPNRLSRSDYLRRLRPVVAAVRDGHTTIGATPSSPGAACLGMDFGVVDEGLYVERVDSPARQGLLGSRLHAANDLPLDRLGAAIEALVGCDNHIHVWRRLAEAFHMPNLLADVLGSDAADPVTFTLKRPDGQLHVELMDWATTSVGIGIGPPSVVALPPVDATQMGWGFADAQHQVAILRVGPLMRYREAGEVWWHSGYRQALRDWHQEIYPGATPSDGDLEAFLANVPAATPILVDCLDAMAHAKTPWLVIDLTASTGGNSVLANMLGWVLYGPEALGLVDDGYQIPRYSRLYEVNYGRLPDHDVSPSGYDYEAEQGWQQRLASGRTAADDQAHAWLREVPTFSAASGGLPGWRPHVVAVSGARTYSAGFDILLTLKSLGAYHVGVPSSQAPNCFIDTLRFTLPHSQLAGTIAFKRSLALPQLDPGVHYLAPDVILTYDTLRTYQFDPAAGVRLALDSIKAGTW